MAMSVSGGESFSLSAAQRSERNILARLQRSHATKQLYQNLWHERKTIEAVTAHHLGQINPSACAVQEMDTWLTGQPTFVSLSMSMTVMVGSPEKYFDAQCLTKLESNTRLVQ